MIRNLPLESATVAAMRGGSEYSGWGVDRYMMANLIDAVKENTHAFISANSKRRVKAPQPVERPGAKQRKQNSFAAMARRAHFANQRAGK